MGTLDPAFCGVRLFESGCLSLKQVRPPEGNSGGNGVFAPAHRFHVTYYRTVIYKWSAGNFGQAAQAGRGPDIDGHLCELADGNRVQ